MVRRAGLERRLFSARQGIRRHDASRMSRPLLFFLIGLLCYIAKQAQGCGMGVLRIVYLLFLLSFGGFG